MAWKTVIGSLLTVMFAVIAGVHRFDWANYWVMEYVISASGFIRALHPEGIYSEVVDHSYFSNGTTDDIRYHMGGIGPFIPKVRNTTGHGIDPPEGCYVDQVHMVVFELSSGLIHVLTSTTDFKTRRTLSNRRVRQQ